MPSTGPLSQLISRLLKRDSGTALLQRAGTSFLLLGAGTALGFVLQVLLARLMGPLQFGYYAYAFAWLNVLSVLARLGWDTTLVRFVSAYCAARDWASLRGLLETSAWVLRLSTISFSLCLAAALLFLHSEMEPDLALTFLVVCLILPFLTHIFVTAGILQALGRVVEAQLPEQILRPVFLAVLVGLGYLFLPSRLDSPTVMGMNFAAVVVCFIVIHRSLGRAIPVETYQTEARVGSREWWAVSRPMYLIAGTQLVLGQIDTVAVGILLDTTTAGIYSVASRLSALIVFGLIAVNTVLGPMISRLHSEGKKDDLQRLIRTASQGIFVYTVPVVIAMLSVGHWLLSLFGPSFVAGYEPLVVLVIGQLVNSLTGSVGTLMTMTGHQRVALRLLAGVAVLDCVLNPIMILLWGATGAAAATAFCVSLLNILMSVAVWRILRIRATIV